MCASYSRLYVQSATKVQTHFSITGEENYYYLFNIVFVQIPYVIFIYSSKTRSEKAAFLRAGKYGTPVSTAIIVRYTRDSLFLIGRFNGTLVYKAKHVVCQIVRSRYIEIFTPARHIGHLI